MPDPAPTIRKASVADGPAIQRLVNAFARADLMLPRALSEVYEHIRDFSVVEADGAVVGCVALAVTWGDLGEVRSLAVEVDHQGDGLGRRLVETCLEEAREMGLPRLFTLTYIPDFFKRFDFRLVEKSDLPHKVWGDCIKCHHFPDCDEVALALDL